MQRKGSTSGRKSTSDSSGGGILRKNSDSALSLMSGSWSSSGPRRQVVVMRHGERVDFCFGKMWSTKSFDEKGVYKRLNPNMPAFLPSRLPSDFAMDSPLTQLGMTLAFETGRSLMEGSNAAGVSYCFASPALRCVQTASQVLRGAGLADSVRIRIEPHLFEWLGWYRVAQPRFMSCAELRAHGYPVDAEYRPVSHFQDLDVQESLERYYERSHKLCKRLLESTKKKGGNLLIVGHAGSLDACTRQLVTGKPERKKMSDARRVISRVPYCASVCVEERRVGGRWQYVEPCVLPFTHGLNCEFRWKEMVGERRVEAPGVLSATKDGR